MFASSCTSGRRVSTRATPPSRSPRRSCSTGSLEATNEWYAIAKIAGIKLCQAYRRQYGRDFISAMPTNLYGPGDNFDLDSSHVIPALIRKFHDAKHGSAERVEVWGTGSAFREFLHVDDLAAACLYLMEHYSEDSHINVGTGVDLSIKELAETIRDSSIPRHAAWDSRNPTAPPASCSTSRACDHWMGTVDRIGRRSRMHLSVVPRPDRCPRRCARGRGRVVLDAQLSWHDRRPGDHTADRICVARYVVAQPGLRLRSYLLGPDGPALEQAQLDAVEILAGEVDGWRMERLRRRCTSTRSSGDAEGLIGYNNSDLWSGARTATTVAGSSRPPLPLAAG